MSKDLELIIEGNLLTMSGANPSVEAVGVTDGLISMTGSPAEVEKYAGKKTKIMKMPGNTGIAARQ